MPRNYNEEFRSLDVCIPTHTLGMLTKFLHKDSQFSDTITIVDDNGRCSEML